MDEEQWRTCADSDQMLGYLLQSGKASERKRRLFTVASYRRLWHLFTDERSRKAVEVSEEYADGFASREDVEAAWDAAEAATAGGLDPHMAIYLALRQPDELEAGCHLLRCIFGNPFRPVILSPAWLTWHSGLVVSMAQRMYESRDFLDMPILADALEEAGCQDPDILGHCRSGGQHVRGCWLIDLLLGKS
jgi:hypothetical protein